MSASLSHDCGVQSVTRSTRSSLLPLPARAAASFSALTVQAIRFPQVDSDCVELLLQDHPELLSAGNALAGEDGRDPLVAKAGVEVLAHHQHQGEEARHLDA